MSVNRTPRILIVDDDENMLVLLHSLLSTEDIQIDVARNGNEAVELIKKEDFKLVITDMMMPEMDGLELSREVKSMNPKTEVIIITCYGNV